MDWIICVKIYASLHRINRVIGNVVQCHVILKMAPIFEIELHFRRYVPLLKLKIFIFIYYYIVLSIPW